MLVETLESTIVCDATILNEAVCPNAPDANPATASSTQLFIIRLQTKC